MVTEKQRKVNQVFTGLNLGIKSWFVVDLNQVDFSSSWFVSFSDAVQGVDAGVKPQQIILTSH